MFLKINSLPTNISSIVSEKQKVKYLLLLAENCSYVSGHEIQFGQLHHQNTSISKMTDMVIQLIRFTKHESRGNNCYTRWRMLTLLPRFKNIKLQ